MKVLFNNCLFPAALTHGGMQVQIDQTMTALRKIGVEVEPLGWWDESQKGDVLHHFGRIPFHHVQMAQQKGMKVVFSDFLGNVASRPQWKISTQTMLVRAARAFFPMTALSAFNWGSYLQSDACIVLTSAEETLATRIFSAPRCRVHLVPNGVEDIFFKTPSSTRGKWLICTATIRDIKRVTELAVAAVVAKTPVWVIGKPYAASDPYSEKFIAFAHRHPEFVRYEGPTGDRQTLARIYREARGFVLLSAYESLSLSALEAAACECPLLLSDLPWARSVFKNGAMYCPVSNATKTATVLRKFYDAAPALERADKPMTWLQVAEKLRGIYESILKEPRR